MNAYILDLLSHGLIRTLECELPPPPPPPPAPAPCAPCAKAPPIIVEPGQAPRIPGCPYWVGERTYTGHCTGGGSVSRTRQAVSNISLEHANKEALRLAKCAVQAAIAQGRVPDGQDGEGDSTPIVYTSTKTASVTLSCPDGSTGADSTGMSEGTATSTVSQEDADAKALVVATYAAESLATLGLSCSGITIYVSTQEYTASCGEGYTGMPVTVSATRTSTVSQGAADEAALNAAQQQAQSSLTCSAVVYNGFASVTVNCPEGTTGTAQTASASATSIISQNDADNQAAAAATAIATSQLSCTSNTFNGSAQATVTCCDGSTQTAYGSSTNASSQSEADSLAYQNAEGNAYAQCPSCA